MHTNYLDYARREEQGHIKEVLLRWVVPIVYIVLSLVLRMVRLSNGCPMASLVDVKEVLPRVCGTT